MNIDSLRAYCRTFPNVSENIQWGNDLVLKIGPKQGGKMFAVACLDPATPVKCSFKCTPEEFVELQERDGIIPAPYLARAQWVALERYDALSDAEFRRLLKQAYELVVAKMPARARAATRAGRLRAVRAGKSSRRTRPGKR
ncbi:MAG TPA: MmcQ/YjbR family DNA-binding protein [Vicinamibacterales bacterium]|jgi:predicted DNA-binding protein (MmcQ/YjbR family)|nr:MmcQ/YjbR family DNA-binding protein [Vicinamibacterales bacterium]